MSISGGAKSHFQENFVCKWRCCAHPPSDLTGPLNLRRHERSTEELYLDAEGFLGQPASSDPSVVLRGEGVSDAQLLTHVLESIISHQPQLFQEFFSFVYGHEHPSLVSFILQIKYSNMVNTGLCVIQTDSYERTISFWIEAAYQNILPNKNLSLCPFHVFMFDVPWKFPTVTTPHILFF